MRCLVGLKRKSRCFESWGRVFGSQRNLKRIAVLLLRKIRRES